MGSLSAEVLDKSTRYIIAGIGGTKVAFPADVVLEISSVEQSTILPLPFYDSRILGVAYYRGCLMPLCTLSATNDFALSMGSEGLIAVRLNESAGNLSGVGIVVSKILGQISTAQIQKDESTDGTSSSNRPVIFKPDDLPTSIWQLRQTSSVDSSVESSAIAKPQASKPSKNEPNLDIAAESGSEKGRDQPSEKRLLLPAVTSLH